MTQDQNNPVACTDWYIEVRELMMSGYEPTKAAESVRSPLNKKFKNLREVWLIWLHFTVIKWQNIQNNLRTIKKSTFMDSSLIKCWIMKVLLMRLCLQGSKRFLLLLYPHLIFYDLALLYDIFIFYLSKTVERHTCVCILHQVLWVQLCRSQPLRILTPNCVRLDPIAPPLAI